MRKLIICTCAAALLLVSVSCGTDEQVATAGTAPASTAPPTTVDVRAQQNALAAVHRALTSTTTTAPPTTQPPPTTAPHATEVPAPPPPAAPAPTAPPAPAVSSGSVWDDLAWCEAGGNWAHPPVGSYGYSGGLMFLPSTWRAYGGQEFAAVAHAATREQQIVVAERILADVGWGAWPGCSTKLGLR